MLVMSYKSILNIKRQGKYFFYFFLCYFIDIDKIYHPYQMSSHIDDDYASKIFAKMAQ